MSSRSLVALSLAVALLVAACGEPVSTPEPILLRVSGSTAMSPLVADLVAAYHDRHPAVNLEIAGLGTRLGLETLRAGDADLAMASWLPGEAPSSGALGQGMDSNWRATAVGRDGIAVIVHPSNPLQGLGLLQLRDLFSGRTYDWQGLAKGAPDGPVVPVSREEGSGTRAAFEALVMGDRAVTPRAAVVFSSRSVTDYVARHPQAIGYVSMAYSSPDVRILPIEGELPTPESAGQGSYPITRDLWLVLPESAHEDAHRFVSFALGPAGQQIVAQRYGRIR